MEARAVRRAGIADAAEIAHLLHDFNTEFSDPTPGVEALTQRIEQLLKEGEVTVLLSGRGPDGLALFRLRPSLWEDGLDAYLEELYVAPPRRGEGLGRALLEETMRAVREAGAIRIDLCTGETDTAARSLYESCGFTNREGGPDDPIMLYYERDL
jgi:ribosomal protein S18 acetylase RimI-like enzyme